MLRPVRLNTTYFFFMANPAQRSDFLNVVRQIYPGNWQFAAEAYKATTEKPFTYLLLDLAPQTVEKFRVRTGIFSNDLLRVFIPKK
jgi:hypothetical protein